MAKTAQHCHRCLYDCATTRYSYSVSSTAFDSEALCHPKNPDPLAQAIFRDLGKKATRPPRFIRRYEQVVYGNKIGDKEICMENLKGVAIVKFQLAGQQITRIKKTKRVTFSESLSNIGRCKRNHICHNIFIFRSFLQVAQLASLLGSASAAYSN